MLDEFRDHQNIEPMAVFRFLARGMFVQIDRIEARPIQILFDDVKYLIPGSLLVFRSVKILDIQALLDEIIFKIIQSSAGIERALFGDCTHLKIPGAPLGKIEVSSLVQKYVKVSHENSNLPGKKGL